MFYSRFLDQSELGSVTEEVSLYCEPLDKNESNQTSTVVDHFYVRPVHGWQRN
jgi:hypothetical protein